MMSPHPARLKQCLVKATDALLRLIRTMQHIIPIMAARAGKFAGTLWRFILSRPASHKSLRLRSSLFFSLFMLTAWLSAALFAWHICREYIDEFFDSQQMLVTRTLAVADLTRIPEPLPRIDVMLPGVKKQYFGELEEEAISFAVFSRNGDCLMADSKKGYRFPFEPLRRGFVNVPLQGNDDVWRILWMDSNDGRHVIAVGQELEYRQDMALEMLEGQLIPWLILIPVLLAGLFIILSRELTPLRSMAEKLRSRDPEDTTALDLQRLPSEVLPMAESLNGFFIRTKEILTRERSFISDAAHELRTPLAGLRIQAQVAGQPGIDQETRMTALAFLRQGIDRCSRLIDQLLALSRLESSYADSDEHAIRKEFSTVNWTVLLEDFLPDYRPRLETENIRLESQITSLTAVVQGNPTLLAMLLRNLLENAASYTPLGGLIRMTRTQNSLTVQNDCDCLPDEYVSRLGERFFRPPGQKKTGSGLGISIVRRIAALHGISLTMTMEKQTPGFSACSFKVTLRWNASPA